MSTPSRAVKLFGTEIEDAPGETLRAGALSVILDAGALRYVRIGGTEIIRAIAFLVRDENWGTLAPEITRLKVTREADRFSVTYEGRCGDARGSLRYRAAIEGNAEGSLRFEVTATPDVDFLTNRTGFIVLHPLEGVAGCPVEVERVDGRRIAGRFPELISPAQPFFDIRSLTYAPLPGLEVTCRMEGDAFEMEDQRNWTDASFKTYVRPLAKPWPYRLPAGEALTQSVSVTCVGASACAAPKTEAAGASAVEIRLGSETGMRMPKIGLGVPADEVDASLACADLIAAARVAMLVCQFDGRRGDLARTAVGIANLAAATGAEIVLEITLPGERGPAEELAEVARAAHGAKLRPAAITVSPAQHLKSVQPDKLGPQTPLLESLYAAARAAFPGVPLGGGTYAYFTELNRMRPPADLLDFVTHTTLPIVHAADDVSVMETLEALPHVIASTRAIIKGKPYRIGPSALAARANPYGAGTAPNPGNSRVCLASMDPRQRGLFGAAWTLGYLAALARGGIEVATLGAPTGASGFVARRCGFAQPYFDDLRVPAVYPLYHVIAGLAAAGERERVAATSSRNSAVVAIAFRAEAGLEAWIGNLTGHVQNVNLAAGDARNARRLILDEDCFVEATIRPDFIAQAGEPLARGEVLVLKPYAIARVSAA